MLLSTNSMHTLHSIGMRAAVNNTITYLSTRNNISSTIRSPIYYNPFARQISTTAFCRTQPAVFQIRMSNMEYNVPVSMRMSSSSSDKDDENDKPSLIEAIARELEEEKESNNSKMPEELLALKNKISDHWHVVVEEDFSKSATIKLFKNDPMKGGGKVVIHFHCQETIDYNADQGMEMDDDTFDESEDDQEEGELSMSTRFSMYVTRLGKTMKLTCSSQDANVTVENVILFEGGISDEGTNEEAYHGPVYDELAEDLQEGFAHFAVQECGADEDVAAFISMYADYQEQVEYMKWLSDVKKMVVS